jgi:hypothetical protein
MRVMTVRVALCVVAVVGLAGCTQTVIGVAAPDPAAAPRTVSSAVAAGPTTPPPLGAAFSDAQKRFTIAPPPGWKADTSGAQNTAVVFLDPTPTRSAQGDFSANINVLVVPSVAGLPATVVGAREELRGLTDYASDTDAAVSLADGTAAHLLGGTFTDKGSGMRLRNLQLFTVHGRSTTVVTGTAPAQGWSTYAPVFDASLRTLTVAT